MTADKRDIVETLHKMHRLSIAWSDSDALVDAIDEIKRLRALTALERQPTVNAIERSLVRQILLADQPRGMGPSRLQEKLLAEIDKLPILDALLRV